MGDSQGWAVFWLVMALVAVAAEPAALWLFWPSVLGFLVVLTTSPSDELHGEEETLRSSPSAARAHGQENFPRPISSPSGRKPVDFGLDNTSGRSLSSFAGWTGYSPPPERPHGAWSRTVTGEGGRYGVHNETRTPQETQPKQNADYASSLRQQASQERNLMDQAFTASKQAYAAGDREKAHNLSVKAKTHRLKRDLLNAEAAKWIFRENNKSQPPGTVDLHGLYVKEANAYTLRAITDGHACGLHELRLIVGKGNRSLSGIAKIKPAVCSFLQRIQLSAQVDQRNSGVLIVQL